MTAIEIVEKQWVEVATGVTSLKMTLVGVEDLNDVRVYRLASGTEAPAEGSKDYDTVVMPDAENVPTSFNNDTAVNVYVMAIGHDGRVLV